MANLFCPFTRAQPEVVILGPFKAGAKPAYGTIETARNRRQMGRVTERQQKLWRPTRLELRGMIDGIGSDLVIVAVDQIGLRMGIEKERQMGQCVVIEEIIMVDKADEFAARRQGSLVGGHRDVAVIGPEDRLDSSVALGPFLQLPVHALVGAGIVDQNQLPRRIALLAHAGDHRPQNINRRVKHGYYD